jgi:hypothetical protein
MRLVTVGHLGKKNDRKKKKQRGGGKEKISLLNPFKLGAKCTLAFVEKFRKCGI